MRTTPERVEGRERLEQATTIVAGAAAPFDLAEEGASGGAEALEAGARVGRYRVLERVGSGGMGVVYAAFDPELERKVALKFLRHDLGGGRAQRQFEARLRHEAQAMAKLAHPNVTAVHDVGRFGGRVFVAMEFVEGPTLGRWLGQERRSVRKVLEAFVAAGRGLAAAHAAGLVHRDFKPDNVLVGDDGRVRVVDFGLARSAGGGGVAPRGDAARGPAPAHVPGLTAAGAMVGTPAYMAPEQHRGQDADAKSDQFSFCVALYEALYGERPFAGATLAELRASVEAGRVRAPRRGRTPRRLRRVIVRGLSASPERRFASMDALLAALGHDPMRRVLQGAAAFSVLAAVGGALSARPRAEPPCRGSERHLQGVWDGARREAVKAALLRTGVPYAGAAAREASRVLDGYASRWASQHAEACEATRVRGEQTEEVLGLRMACLDERQLELKALSDRLLAADGELVEQAVQASYRLSELEGCADVRALSSPVRPPPDAATRAEVEALRARLAELRALEHAGRYKEGLEAARQLGERAGALRYRPLEAEASYLLGELADEVGDFDAADRALEQAAWAAEAGRHDEVAARASTALLRVRGLRRARYDQVEPLTRRVTAALERLGGNTELEAQLGLERGHVGFERGLFAEAERELLRALELIEARYGPGDLRLAEPLRTLAQIAVHRSEEPKALAYVERALEVRRRALGDEHPEVADDLIVLGGVRRSRAEYAQAEAAYEQALALLGRSVGPEHYKAAKALSGLADVYLWQGGVEKSVALHRQALTLLERRLGAEHPEVAVHSALLANALEVNERLAEAQQLYQGALRLLRQHFGQEHPRIAELLLVLARVQVQRGELAKARDMLLEARAMKQRVLGPEHDVSDVLQTLGDVEVRTGRPSRAVEPLELALAAQVRRREDPGVVALTKGLLARALFDSGGDRDRARALAREALAHMKGDGRMDEERAALERWVRQRGVR